MPSAARARFYVTALRRVMLLPQIPEAAELGAWIKQQTWEDPPADLAVMVERLELWQPGHPYPPFPDDEAVKHGTHPPDPRWWRPGAMPRAELIRAAIDAIDAAS